MHPFADKVQDQVSTLGERQLIQRIREWLGPCSPPSPEGIGDDAAVLPGSLDDLVVAKDCLVFNKHFNAETPPHLAGAKLLKRNLSDFAAMGAKPSHVLIACLLPPTTSVEWIEGFYLGILQTANAYSISIVGGDIASTFRDLAFTLTLLGFSGEKPLTRKSAHPGDSVWVTGELGGSIQENHLHFTPRLEEGIWLAKQGIITSAMDISDGLATDLDNFCPDHCTIEINTDALPISQDAKTMAADSGRSAAEHALTDGEDYELIFTLKFEADQKAFLASWNHQFNTRLSHIGTITARESEETPRICYTGSLKTFKGHGYEHF